MRRMLLLIALAVLVCGCLTTSYKIAQPARASAGEPTTRTDREFKASMGQRLEVDLKSGGSIEITGWDRDAVSVSIYEGDGACDDCELDIRETSAGIQIRRGYNSGSRNHYGNLRLEIKVPARFDLELETAGGSMSIQNVQGKMRGKTMGGKLILENLKGELDLTTMGGRISLTSSDVDGKVKTMGGAVLLQDVRGDVNGVSMGGDVVYKNVTRRNGETTGDEVHIKTMGGDIKIDTAPAGAQIMTMGGDIRIGSASRFAKVKTMGGDINLESVDGWVNATTMSGDISVNMLGNSGGRHDVELTSYSGDITFTVPANLSMEFDISLAYTKNREGRYSITSDFPLQQREDAEWTYDKGDPRKYIYGTGSAAGGANRIKISTINGNVRVKKG